MRHLQPIQDRYADQGLVVLGMNVSDARDIALEELRRQDVRFANVIDSSQAALDVEKSYRGSGVPLKYAIDRQGRVIDAWYGGEENFHRTLGALRKAGIKTQPSDSHPAGGTEPASEPAN